MLNIMLKIIKDIKNKLSKFLPHKIINESHYGLFLGSFEYLRLFSWNIFHPTRVLSRIIWRVLFVNKREKIIKYEKESKELENKISIEKLDYFLENGGVLLPNFFEDKIINNFLNEYKSLINQKKLDNQNRNDSKKVISIYKKIRLHLSKSLIDIWLNDAIIRFIKTSLGTDNIYAREYPRLVYTKYVYEKSLTSREMNEGVYKNYIINGPYFWHTDHTAGLINVHILLEDINLLKAPHMQFLPGSNKFFNSRDFYSDETINKFKNKPIDCIGKRGTIYFHQGNTLHRVVGVKNSERLSLIFSFSKGSGVELSAKDISILLSGDYDIENLTKEKRKILSGLAPLNRMIEIKKNKISSPLLNEVIE